MLFALARPTFALRSYLPDDHPDKEKEIGSEPTPEEFIATMVALFREVRRVLRDDGFLWVNLGDSYSGSWGNYGNRPELDGKGGTQRTKKAAYINRGGWDGRRDRPATSYMPQGNQLLIPHRVALALQADGWILRDTVVWAKRSPMPSSQNGIRWSRCMIKVKGCSAPNKGGVRGTNMDEGWNEDTHPETRERAQYEPCPGCERCEPNGGYVLRRGSGRTTTAHEYLFLFVKQIPYFWDMENCREEAVGGTPGNKSHQYADAYGNGELKDHSKAGLANIGAKETRIPRSVWTLSSEGNRFAHFATFPSELVRRMLSPLSPKGCCPHCGAQWAPVVESERYATRPGNSDKQAEWKHMQGDAVGQRSASSPNLDPQRHLVAHKVTDYRPTCTCPEHEPVSCTVLDPFSGLATVGQTANYLGHDFIGCELNEEYAAYAEEWIMQKPRWAKRQEPSKPKRFKDVPGQAMLFS